MSYSISNWSGRLGNNIQQVANCIMAAEKNNTDFTQVLDHDIISKFYVNFGSNIKYESGRFYTWEALVNCENECYEGGNETGVGVEHNDAAIAKVPTPDSATFFALINVAKSSSTVED